MVGKCFDQVGENGFTYKPFISVMLISGGFLIYMTSGNLEASETFKSACLSENSDNIYKASE